LGWINLARMEWFIGLLNTESHFKISTHKVYGRIRNDCLSLMMCVDVTPNEQNQFLQAVLVECRSYFFSIHRNPI